MKFGRILKERRQLCTLVGKIEYLFFPSILVSAAALCALVVMAVDALFKTDEVRSAYVSLFSSASQSALSLYSPSMPDFLENALAVFYSWLAVMFENAPAALSFFVMVIFALCPIYQGTVRYCAYLIEEKKPLPLTAVLFYFKSARLYFGSVYLSLRLAIKRGAAAICFFMPPAVCFALGSALSSVYFGQRAAAAAIMLLSIGTAAVSAVLYVVFCRRYFAVRYIYALGARRKIFKVSAKLSQGKRTSLFALSLRLSLNLVPALLILPAPAAISRMVCGEGLVVHSLLSERALSKEKTA